LIVARHRWPGLTPALAKSRCSSIASVKSASSGQAIPAAAQRRSVKRTVDDATPTRRAISRIDMPEFFNRTQSRTWVSIRGGLRSEGFGNGPAINRFCRFDP
jgi:hypothetical protein